MLAGMDNSERPVALITGAAKRIGARIARRLHAAGYDLALHYRGSKPEMDALVAELEADRADSVIALQADLAQFDRLPELVARTIGRFGRLDALVNNASLFQRTEFGPSTPAQWDVLFNVNARAPYFLAQTAAPHLKRSGGAIVNITDLYVDHALAGHALYSMSKAALAQMTRALALELAPDVRVNAIAPGAILWPEATDAATLARQQAILERTPLARTGTPDEVADAVLWLLRDAGFLTGHSLPLDGGRALPV